MISKWRLINIVTDGQPIMVGGINPWEYEWVQLVEEPIEVPHPSYPNQMHKMRQYKIDLKNKSIVFAAGEYSNCVWGFYVPEL